MQGIRSIYGSAELCDSSNAGKKLKKMEYIDKAKREQIQSYEAVEEWAGQNGLSEWETNNLLRTWEAAYDLAEFVQDVAKGPLSHLISPEMKPRRYSRSA